MPEHLVTLQKSATLGTMNAVVAENYGLYHECREKHKDLAEWVKNR